MTSRMRRSLKRWRMSRRFPWRNEQRHREAGDRPVMPLKPSEGAPPRKARQAPAPAAPPAPQETRVAPREKPPVGVPPRDLQRLEREVQRLAAGFSRLAGAQPATAAPSKDELVGTITRLGSLEQAVRQMAARQEKFEEVPQALREIWQRLRRQGEVPARVQEFIQNHDRIAEELRLALGGAAERLKELEGVKDVVRQLADGNGRVARVERAVRDLGRGVGTLEGLGDRLDEVAKRQGTLEQLVPRVRELGTRIEELERREASDEAPRRQLAEVGGRLQNVEGLPDELRALRRRISETERTSGDLKSLAARLGSSESTVSRVAAALEGRMQQLEAALEGRLDRLAARAAQAGPRRPGDGESAGRGQSLSDAVAGLRAEIDAIRPGPALDE